MKIKKRKKRKFYYDWLFKLPPGIYHLKELVVHAQTSTSSVVRCLRNLGLQAEYVRNEKTRRPEAVYTWDGKDSLL